MSRIRRRQGERLPDSFHNAGVPMLMDNGKNQYMYTCNKLFIEHFNQLFDDYDSW